MHGNFYRNLLRSFTDDILLVLFVLLKEILNPSAR